MYPDLEALIKTALNSPGLLSPNDFNLARYSLHSHVRNRLLDPDIGALEDYLIDHSQLPGASSNRELLDTFGDIVHNLCYGEGVTLQISYQNLSWLLAWLNMRHPPAYFGEDPDSPLQILQMVAAVGFGEWAGAFNQIEDGIDTMLNLAKSPLWRVREAAMFGLRRLLIGAWESTVRRLRYRAVIAIAPEWRCILEAISHPDVLSQQEGVRFAMLTERRVIDALDLQQQALRYLYDMDEKKHDAELWDAVSRSLAQVVMTLPPVGFAHLTAWAAWSSPATKAVIRGSLPHLQTWKDQVLQIKLALTD